MKPLRNLFNFYLDASIHVALAVVSLAGVTAQMLNISSNPYLLGFIFCGTVVCYNFVKYGVEAEKYLIVSNLYQRNIQILSFLSFLLALFFLVHLKKEIWAATIVLSLISMLYAVPLLPNAKNLRSLGGFKIYIVALVWTGFTVLLPILEEGLSLGWNIVILAIQRFLLVLILILPFEIRDMRWDDKALKTLPQTIGPHKTQRLGLILICVYFVLTFLKDVMDFEEILLRFVLVLCLGLSFILDHQKQSKYFSSFWIEGMPLLWLGFILLWDRVF